MEKLNDDILYLIFDILNIDDSYALSKVNRRSNRIFETIRKKWSVNGILELLFGKSNTKGILKTMIRDDSFLTGTILKNVMLSRMFDSSSVTFCCRCQDEDKCELSLYILDEKESVSDIIYDNMISYRTAVNIVHVGNKHTAPYKFIEDYFHKTIDMNYWIPSDSKAIYCGYAKLTLKSKSVLLTKLDDEFTGKKICNNIIAMSNAKDVYKDYSVEIVFEGIVRFRLYYILSSYLYKKYIGNRFTVIPNSNNTIDLEKVKNMINSINIEKLDTSYIDDNRYLYPGNNILFQNHNTIFYKYTFYSLLNFTSSGEKIISFISDPNIKTYVETILLCKNIVFSDVRTIFMYIVTVVMIDNEFMFESIYDIFDTVEATIPEEEPYYKRMLSATEKSTDLFMSIVYDSNSDIDIYYIESDKYNFIVPTFFTKCCTRSLICNMFSDNPIDVGDFFKTGNLQIILGMLKIFDNYYGEKYERVISRKDIKKLPTNRKRRR
ncbi:hypothetical protein HDU92_007743 [Lobulomyces angularis]|nr:hypothetical protein HDU92_007743 [Lobulomyces angularis]